MTINSGKSAATGRVSDNGDAARKPWSAPRVIESKVSRRTEKATTPFTSAESHDPSTTAVS